jgi:hypothetical protein
VKRYFQSTSGFTAPEVIKKAALPSVFNLFQGSDPFYAVLAQRSVE